MTDTAAIRNTEPAEQKSPLVSVIIPVYNVEAFLEECLESVIGQTLQNIEIICVNDGSTDGSAEIIRRCGERDARIVCLTQENAGQSAARNLGLEHAGGKYVSFLDSDDMLEPGALERLYGLAEREMFDQIVFSARAFADPGAVLPEEYISHMTFASKMELDYTERIDSGKNLMFHLLETNNFRSPVGFRFLRKSVLDGYNLRFPAGILHEDEYFTPMTFLVSQKSCVVNEQLYLRRLRNGSVMSGGGGGMVHFDGLFKAASLLLNDIPCTLSPGEADALLDYLFFLLEHRYSALSAEEQAAVCTMEADCTHIQALLLRMLRLNAERRALLAALNSWSCKLGRALAWGLRPVCRIVHKVSSPARAFFSAKGAARHG